MRVCHFAAIIAISSVLGFQTGLENMKMLEHFMHQFSAEESDGIMNHKKPLIRGESGRDLTEAMHDIEEISKRGHIPDQNVEGALTALRDARQLRKLAAIMGDEPDS